MPGILVGIDGSDHSHRALDWAIREAAVRHAPLTVVTVYQATTGYWGAPFSYPVDPELVGQAREKAQQETDEALEKADGESRPLSVTVRVVSGLPADSLLQAAEDADLLVVGSRGSGGFKRLLLGSVSTQVTHHARCPVVVIPTEDV